MVVAEQLSIGEVAQRAGVSVPTLRYYESLGLIAAHRTPGNHRTFDRDVLRRLAFIRVAQRVGLTLDEVSSALAALPDARTPTPRDWDRLSARWRARLDEQIALLERLRDDLSACIGCGCLSIKACSLYNPADVAATLGDGPRFLLGDTSERAIKKASTRDP